MLCQQAAATEEREQGFTHHTGSEDLHLWLVRRMLARADVLRTLV